MSTSLFDQNNPNNPNNEQDPLNRQLSQSARIGGAGVQIGAGNATNLGGKTAGSGRFTNLQSYMDANSGAGENISNRISGAVNNQYDTFGKQYDTDKANVDKSTGDAQNLFNNEGKTYTNKLDEVNKGFNSFNGMGDRGTFDSTGQDLMKFYNDNKDPFNNMRQGTNFNQVNAKTQNDTNLFNTQQKGIDVNRQLNDIQTEQGRNGLLSLANPRFGSLTQGQSRLDNALFQTQPNAIRGIQNTLASQQNDLANKQAALLSQSSNISDVGNQQKNLASTLKTGANNAQDAFYNKLNQQSVKDDINNARTGVYNNYLGQLNTGNISQELANMLNLNTSSKGVVDTYNPTPSNATNFSPDKYSNVMQGISPFPSNPETPPQAAPLQNTLGAGQFRTYNDKYTTNDANGVPLSSKYLQQNGPASNFQDVLRQPDYDVYNTLAGLSGQDTLKANGISQLAPAVSVKSDANLKNDITKADTDFKSNYLKEYATPYYGDAEYHLQPYNTLNDYLAKGEVTPQYRNTLNNSNFDPTASGVPISLQNANKDQLKSQLDAAVTNSGVKNVATINQAPNQIPLAEQEQYKRFKGLL